MVHLFFVYPGLILICITWENWNRTNILSWCIPKTCKVYLFTAYLRFPTMYYPLPQVGMGLNRYVKIYVYQECTSKLPSVISHLAQETSKLSVSCSFFLCLFLIRSGLISSQRYPHSLGYLTLLEYNINWILVIIMYSQPVPLGQVLPKVKKALVEYYSYN